MKKLLSILLLLPFMAMFTGCNDDDDLIFDHELPQFELRDNAILLEVIMPNGSAADDSYYIVGDFNGGKDEAVGNPAWKLQKAENSNIKWGIYLVPDTFVNGKTLADGYYFYSVAQGEERSINNEAVKHVLDNARVGTRTNVWVDRWAAYFDGGQPQKDYYTIYVDDQSGEDVRIDHLYIYGSSIEPAPTWPGWEATGTTTIGGIEFVYFDIDKAYNGETMNIIFNGNDGKWQTTGGDPSITLDKDLYFRVTSDKKIEELDPNDLQEAYQGWTIYADDQTGWAELALYAWGDLESAGWPGWQPAGKKDINGVSYTYFEPGEEYSGLSLNLIFNNNVAEDGTQLGDVNITLDKDFYFQVTSSRATEVDPFYEEPSSWKIYAEDALGWGEMALHYWGDDVTSTNWPGLQPTGTETFGDRTYYVFDMPAAIDGKEITIILNNNDNGVQSANYPASDELTIDRDYIFTIVDNGTANPDVEPVQFKVYANNQTGWTTFNLHYWNDFGWSTSWPGVNADGTENINGTEYKYFEIPVELTGYELGLIFNNKVGDDGVQLDNAGMTANRDYYFQVTTTGATEVNP